MKKRAVMAAMVAALVLSQATTAFAAGSTSSGGSGRATVSATYADEVSITLNGNTTTPNYGGEASNGATSVAFVKGDTHAVAGLRTASLIRSMPSTETRQILQMLVQVLI